MALSRDQAVEWYWTTGHEQSKRMAFIYLFKKYIIISQLFTFLKEFYMPLNLELLEHKYDSVCLFSFSSAEQVDGQVHFEDENIRFLEWNWGYLSYSYPLSYLKLINI